MTLVVVGHDLQPSLSFLDDGAISLESNGIFVATDSAITRDYRDGRQIVLAGFRKAYAITAKLWQPSFIGEHFNGYRTVYQEIDCVLAFAGGVLTAQHIMNSITEHLGKLRITYIESDGGAGAYKVVRHCQDNPLERMPGGDVWGEDMFLPTDYEGLLTADVISDNVLHSIKSAVSSAKKYKIDEEGFRSLYTEFALGVYCPVERKYRLFKYSMSLVRGFTGLYEIEVNKGEVPEDDIVVLGMRSQFENNAKIVFEYYRSRGKSPTDLMLDFVNYAIDTAGGIGSEIDRPSVLKVLNGGRLSMKEYVS